VAIFLLDESDARRDGSAEMRFVAPGWSFAEPPNALAA
jgi:hypothetical protein